MVFNKIIDVIIGITAFIVIPLQVITTFVLSILVQITFGLLLVALSILWAVIFMYPLLALSWIWEKVVPLRLVVGIVGIPIAVIGNIYVSLIPHMGELDSRISKLLYCQTFPFTLSFHQALSATLSNESTQWFELDSVLKRLSRNNEPVRQYLDVIYNRYDL